MKFAMRWGFSNWTGESGKPASAPVAQGEEALAVTVSVSRAIK